jgi:phage terminase large subunit GpA-like protein
MTALADIRRWALAVLGPPPKLALSAWLESHVHLPQGLSADPGPLRLWAFQRGIADAIGDPAIERVSVLKSARVGFTSLLCGAIASYVANDPAPILVVMPTGIRLPGARGGRSRNAIRGLAVAGGHAAGAAEG